VTAGEHLVSLSGLGAATAAQHLLAIVAGGAATTIFATQMTLRVSTPETVVVTRAKRSARAAETPKPAPKPSVRKKSIAVMTPIQETVVLTETDQLFIRTEDRSTIITTALLGASVKTK